MRFLVAMCAISLGVAGFSVRAAEYPSQPITMIVPFSAGSGTDTVARAVASVMQRELKTSVVVDNRPGASGMIAASDVLKSKSDGYTIFVGAVSTNAANPVLFKHLSYDPARDFIPVGSVAGSAPVLLVRADTNIKTIADVLRLAKEKKGKLNFGSSNASGLFSAEMFKHNAGIAGEVVNYSSASQAHVDVASGQLDFIFGDFVAGGGLMQAGKLRPIAIAASKRLSMFPDIPTVAEGGVDGVMVPIWVGMFAPKGTSDLVVERLNQALAVALQNPGVLEIFKKGALDARISTPSEFAAYVAGQQKHWAGMARQINYRPQ